MRKKLAHVLQVWVSFIVCLNSKRMRFKYYLMRMEKRRVFNWSVLLKYFSIMIKSKIQKSSFLHFYVIFTRLWFFHLISERVILWWMLLSGIVIHIFQSTNINVAIISMVKHRSIDIANFTSACEPAGWIQNAHHKNSNIPDSRVSPSSYWRLNSCVVCGKLSGAYLWYKILVNN